MLQTPVRPAPRGTTPVDLAELLGVRNGTRVALRPFAVPRGVASGGRFDGPVILIEGVLLRTVGLGRRTSSTLYGPGDVVPGARDEDGRFTTAVRALAPSRVAPLDVTLTTAAAASPDVAMALLDRVDRRTDELALQAILTQLVSIRERLEVLLPHLSERWGTVSADGVLLPAFLSHTVLAALVGVRRPSLTTALVELAESGQMVRRDDRRWRISPDLAGL